MEQRVAGELVSDEQDIVRRVADEPAGEAMANELTGVSERGDRTVERSLDGSGLGHPEHEYPTSGRTTPGVSRARNKSSGRCGGARLATVPDERLSGVADRGAVEAPTLLREVLEVTSRLAAAPDRAAIAMILVDHGIRAFRADAGAVHLVAPDGDTVVMAASKGWPERETKRFERFSVRDDLPAALAVRTGASVTFSSAEELLRRYPELASVQEAIGDSGWMIVPIGAGRRMIGVIGLSSLGVRTWSQAERELLETLAATAGQALERAAAHEAAMSIALDLQRALLPRGLVQNAAFESRAMYLPAPGVGEVGGDWYEVLAGSDDVLFVIGDVAGHGLDAARTMAAVRYGLAALAHAERDPSSLLARTDDHLRAIDDEAMVTCCVVRLEYATRTLTWACAGHPPPVLIGAASASLLQATAGPPLGVGHREAYLCTARRVAPGESILLYTDGLVERRGEDLTTGFGRLLRAAGGVGGGSPEELVDAVLTQLAPGSQDDIAILAVRVT